MKKSCKNIWKFQKVIVSLHRQNERTSRYNEFNMFCERLSI
nr:MAG TPA: hypothetical protein [Caudoviricetes sp.]